MKIALLGWTYWAAALLALSSMLIARQGNAAVNVVSTTADNGPGLLRAIVASVPSGAVITFASSLSGQTILLTSGAISLSNNMTIDGSALASPVKVYGNHNSAVFRLDFGAVFLNSLIITNGFNDFGGGVEQNAFGESFITLSNCVLTGPNCFSPGSVSNCCTTADTTGVGNITNAPMLAPLGNYGGPTQTMPPLPGSPVIDAGADSITNQLAVDQRGYPRLAGSHVDIGAVEGLFVAAGPGKLTGTTRVGNGSVQFAFTNFTGASFPVLSSTSLSLPASNWTQIGFTTETPGGSGHFQFTDTQATSTQKYYRLRSP